MPIALTEIHNGCTREEQVRWLNEAWATAREARARWIDLRAVTAWSLFGSQGWNTLLTDKGVYEPGAFDVSSGTVRTIALARAIGQRGGTASGRPWWRRDIRLTYPAMPGAGPVGAPQRQPSREDAPLLILGASGTLGRALAAECHLRDLACVVTNRAELDLGDPNSIERAIERHHPWAVANAAGWVRVDDAEDDLQACHAANATGAVGAAQVCARVGLPSLNFSTDLVFDSETEVPYSEQDAPNPLNVYGRSKLEMEERLAGLPGRHLVIRTAAFFSPHDQHNFAVHCVNALARQLPFVTASDCAVSPTYVPDLCRAALDLLIDREAGIWHLTNGDAVTWHAFAERIAEVTGTPADSLAAGLAADMGWRAPRPRYSALTSQRGQLMPGLDSAIARFAEARTGSVART